MAAQWRNWSGLQKSQPKHVLFPKNSHELIETIQAHQKIRVVGAGHSFSPLVITDETLISLDHLQGLIEYDEHTSQAKLWAGTRIYQFPKLLDPINQALINQGDIDEQSIAGAISTGTHGTGVGLGCLSDLVVGFELLTSEGKILYCDALHHPDIFAAGRVNLGSFGVLTKVRLQNRPRYKLKEQVQLCAVDDILKNMNAWRQQHRHIESFIFPFHHQALLKTLNESNEAISPKKEDWPSEDTLLTLCCETTKFMPSAVSRLQKLVGVFVKKSTQVNWSGAIFPSPRHTKFNEMEYQIPIEQGMQCLAEVISTFKAKKLPAFFPIEVRYVKADEIWLSPFYQQDSLSISIHQYAKQDCQVIFDAIEPVFKRYGGRPHWGKIHSLTAAELELLYPKWQDFQQLRQRLDPTGKFLNPYLEKIFGL